jgi:hypothetical protein
MEIKLQKMVNGYIGSNFKDWFDNHRHTKLKKNFEKIIINNDENDDEIITIYRDEFIEDLTNRWNEPKCPNFFKQYKLLNHEFTIRDFIKFWEDCSEWFNNNFDYKIEIEDEETTWNTFSYWIFSDKLIDEWQELFIEKFKEEFCNYKDIRNRTSSISCGICYENKILYTGCFCCNNNYLCQSCYDNVDNECPFCRCNQMIKEVDVSNDNFQDDLNNWIEKIAYILRDIRKNFK